MNAKRICGSFNPRAQNHYIGTPVVQDDAPPAVTDSTWDVAEGELKIDKLSLKMLHMEIFDTPGDTPLSTFRSKVSSISSPCHTGRRWGPLHEHITQENNLPILDLPMSPRMPLSFRLECHPEADDNVLIPSEAECASTASDSETEDSATEEVTSAKSSVVHGCVISPRAHAALTLDHSGSDGLGVLVRLEEEIRRRAREHWIETGNPSPEENWLVAERSILRGSQNPKGHTIRELQHALHAKDLQLQAQADRILYLERALLEKSQ
mmetsp:Transcript_9187/g.15034  ORF Transcript_9187/g.15034 Transcript_9187/m.15034 type:complete len:266 (+) Transcript_9187:55-852(+)